MRKLFVRLLQLSPLMIAVVATNYVIDPANRFHDGALELGIADYLVKGYNVTDVNYYNDRLLQRYLIRKSDECPSTIAIGASRIMTLGQSAANHSNFRNNGVNSATLEDYLGIVELYEEKGCKIDKVIIALEPYLLNDAHGLGKWIALDREVNAMMQKIYPGARTSLVSLLKLRSGKYFALFSPTYFRNSLEIINATGKDYSPTHEMFNTGRTIIADGSFTYGVDDRTISPDVVEQRVQNEIASNRVYAMADFYELSPRYKDMFEKFVDHLQGRHIEVEFRLFPYAPSMYRFFEENEYYNIVAKADRYFRAVAKEKGITVIGSYDPKTLGLTNSSFQDAYHLKREEQERIGRSAVF